MNKQELITKRVQQIQEIVANDEAADGIDAMAAALSSSLLMAQATGIFDKKDVHDFITELENRINKVLANKPDIISRKKNIEISRRGN